MLKTSLLFPNPTASSKRFLRHDGSDPATAFKAGVELSVICLVGLLILLTVYYVALRALLALCTRRKAETKNFQAMTPETKGNEIHSSPPP